jgi:hypothetical protein
MIGMILLVTFLVFVSSLLVARSKRKNGTAVNQGKATNYVKRGELPEDDA